MLALVRESDVHQSLRGVSDQEPSLLRRVTSRLGEIRGGPHGAVSDVGDPTERLASLSAFRLPKCDVVRLTVLTAHLGSLP